MTTLEFAPIPLTAMELRAAEDDRHYIEGIAVPWGKRTDRAAVPELFERGAFRDLVASGAKVKLTDYNHSRDRVPVAYSCAVEDRDAGLWMRFKLNRTPEGRSAQENVADGVYGGLSVGFMADAERMVDGVRHITAARLDHVSLVESPAYEDAVITELRAAIDAERAEWADLIRNRPMPLDIAAHMSQNRRMAIIRRGAVGS